MKERRANRAEGAPDTRRAPLLERIRLLEANVPNVIVGNSICVVAVWALLLDKLPPSFLYGWLAAQVMLTSWRFLLLRRWRKHARRHVSPRLRLSAAIAHATLSGSLWGLLGYVGVSSADPFTSLVVTMIITGLVAGATAMVSHLPPVYLPYVFTMGDGATLPIVEPKARA